MELATTFANCGAIRAVDMKELHAHSFEIIVNGTASSLHGELPGVPAEIFRSTLFVYDMMYARQPTLFMKWALDMGARQVTDGLGMLVEQAALGFEIWHGVKVKTAPVISALRQGV